MYSRDEAKQLRKNFWITFSKRCEIIPELMHRKKNWMLYDTGISGIDLKFEIDRSEALVMIEINHKNEDRRLEAFSLLQQYKGIIEQNFEKSFEWELCYRRESGENVSRIFTKKIGLDIHNKEQWADAYNFFISNMIELEKNFMEIRDILKEQLKNQ